MTRALQRRERLFRGGSAALLKSSFLLWGDATAFILDLDAETLSFGVCPQRDAAAQVRSRLRTGSRLAEAIGNVTGWMMATSPHALIARHAAHLLDCLPGVRDGSPESVHEMRVATRRLRELFPLQTSLHDRRDRDRRTVRVAGRALGRVRELDVMDEVLARQEERFPAVAAVVAVARAALRPQRIRARRRLIARLEALDLEGLRDRRPTEMSTSGRLAMSWADRRRAWAEFITLQERIGTRASEVEKAVSRATGVYFPDRAHSIRIATKKLRYAAEIAGEMRVWEPAHLLKDLKRVQSILGNVHDLEVLLGRLDGLIGSSSARADLPLLLGALQSERGRGYRKYLGDRDRLLAICAACHRFADRPPRSVGKPIVAASLAAVPVLWLLGGRRSA